MKTIFKRIDIDKRTDTLEKVIYGTSNHIKLPTLNNHQNWELIYEILTGVHQIHFDAIEHKDGTLFFSNEEDFLYMSAISNFYFGDYGIGDYYFNDLTGYEQNIFENLEVTVTTLRLPYTVEDMSAFRDRIR